METQNSKAALIMIFVQRIGLLQERQAYDELQEMPYFIVQQCQKYVNTYSDSEVYLEKRQGKQLEAYQVLCDKYLSRESRPSLRMVISGTAGTGKFYLIKCVKKKLLGEHLCMAAPTGVAAYNVLGYTLHSLMTSGTLRGNA